MATATDTGVASDEACMAALAAGDEQALAPLMERWERPLKTFLYRMVLNAEDAADLAQETFVRVYRHRARYRVGASFRSWLLTLAANLARNHLRWRWYRRAFSIEQLRADTGDAWEPADAAPDAAGAAERQESALRVRAAIAALPTELREVLILFEYQELGYQEIATIAGCTPKAVETRLYRARAHLRRSLGSGA